MGNPGGASELQNIRNQSLCLAILHTDFQIAGGRANWKLFPRLSNCPHFAPDSMRHVLA
jgi:hypothetical protein